MPKWLTVVIVVVFAVALVSGGAAFAAYRTNQVEAPRASWSGGWPMGASGFGGPMMGGRGGVAGPMGLRGFAGPMMGAGGGVAGPMGLRGFAGPMMGVGGGLAGGAMHDYVLSALADALGLTAEDLNARLQDGETLAGIAEGQGLTLDELTEAHEVAFEQAVQAAVDSGDLTQEEADWILDHHAAGRFFGAGPIGMMGGRGGFMHGWAGPRGWGESGGVPAP